MKALVKSAHNPCTLHALGYLALALALGGWAVHLTLKACGGQLVPPLDDSYIYLQYARAAAHGHPLRYTPGALPSRGATSLLYPLVLAPFARLLSPDRLPWAAWGLGVLCLAGTALAADRWAARRLGPRAAWPAGLLVLASGHFLWGAVSGMDVALYAFCLAAAAAAVPWYEDAPDPASGIRRLAALALLLAAVSLARPEGMLIAGAVAGLVPFSSHAPNSRRARWILVLAPAAAALLTFGIDLLALGRLGSNTLAAKAVWSTPAPDVHRALLARLPWVLGQITVSLFTDFRAHPFGPWSGPLVAALFAGGALAGAAFALLRRSRGAALPVVTAILAGGLLAGLVPVGFNSHHERYQIPYVPLALLLALAGWWRIWPRRFGTAPRLAAPVLLGVCLLPGLVRYERLVAENAENICDQQVAAGRWIDRNLAPDAVVALNDAGALAYYGNRKVLDLVGLVTDGPALPNRAGPASLYEWLEKLPPGRRPTHFAIFPTWFPYLRHTSLVGRKLAQFTLGRNTISGSDVMGIYEADWSNVDRTGLPVLRQPLIGLWGFRIVDALDASDLASERAHGYAAFDTWRQSLREFPHAGRPGRFLIDGGNEPHRGERFTMKALSRRPGVLVLRTEAYREFALDVFVNGISVGTLKIAAHPLEWTEPFLELPDSVFTGSRARFELRLAPPPSDASEYRYASYQYWLLQ